MIKLEIPAQVMLAVDAGESGVYAQLPSFFWHRVPVVPRQVPDLRFDRNAGLAGGVQAQQGILGVGVVAMPRPFRLVCNSTIRARQRGRRA